MNLRLLLQTLRWNRARLLALVAVSFGWGILMPVVYASFSDALKQLANSGTIPKELFNFGSGSIFTLPGVLTLGLQHPLAIAFIGIFAVGSTTGAIAGERQRGTLEVLLARPLARRALYLTVGIAALIMISLVLAALLVGQMVGVAIERQGAELDLVQMPLVFVNGLLLWGAFAAFGLAASVSFDRLGPALGVTLAFLLVNYFLEILGSLWRDVAWSQSYSLFHYFQPGKILTGDAAPFDFLLLAAATVIPVVYALIVFPRRDLAAPA
ncbi:MAG: ABC transporter permease subunit [Candidatus Limnocylindria bacterium]